MAIDNKIDPNLEREIKNDLIEKIVAIVQNGYKNNIYWKWASNDIADAIRALKIPNPPEK